MQESGDEPNANQVLAQISREINPDRDPPDCQTLSIWLTSGECPQEALKEASDHFKKLWKTDKIHIPADVDARGDLFLSTTLYARDRGIDKVNIGTLAREWATLPSKDKPRFPLTPVIKAWHKHPRDLEPERRSTAIIPMTTRIRAVGQLTFDLGILSGHPILGELPQQAIATHLPGLDPVDDTMVVSPLLLLYDHSNLPSKSGGHGAPLSMRLWMESIMAISLSERGNAGRMTLDVREIIEWLWPNGSFRAIRHMDQLVRAVTAVNHSLIRWKGGYWAAVLIRNYPVTPDDRLLMEVELPPGSGRGPLIHRIVLRHYGVQSAALYRAYLAAVYMWDEFGTHGGKVIQATRPAVLRDDDGSLLDYSGRKIVDRDGRPIRRWSHSKAVPLGEREPNPAASRYPLLTEDDLLRMVNATGTDHSRAARRAARRAFDKMAEDQIITLDDRLTAANGEPGFRIMPPENWGPDWIAPNLL